MYLFLIQPLAAISNKHVDDFYSNHIFEMIFDLVQITFYSNDFDLIQIIFCVLQYPERLFAVSVEQMLRRADHFVQESTHQRTRLQRANLGKNLSKSHLFLQ